MDCGDRDVGSLGDSDPLLAHVVAIANGHCVVFFGLRLAEDSALGQRSPKPLKLPRISQGSDISHHVYSDPFVVRIFEK